MKAKIFLMAFAAIAAVSMSSCTQDEELFVKDGDGHISGENAVVFGTYLGKAPETRSSVMDLSELKKTGFGVLAYYTGETEYMKDKDTPVGTFTPNFMYNQEVTWQKSSVTGEDGTVTEGGRWTYSPVKYWPSNLMDKISFFAYAPYVDDFAGKTEGITGLTANTAAGDPKLLFVMPKAQEDQIDLLYDGSLLNLSKETIDSKIQFEFKHTLSRIGFSRVAVVDQLNPRQDGDLNTGEIKYENTLAEGTRVVINSVKFSSAEFGKSGNLNLRTGAWENVQTANQTYELSRDNGDFIDEASTMTPENANKIMQLNKEGHYFMIMPSNADFNVSKQFPVTITVNFDVITTDGNLAGSESKITSEASTTFLFDFFGGKAYNFILNIALTSVKLDAEIIDWDTEYTEGYDNEFHYDITNNNSVSLIYDANFCKFANGSRYYIESKAEGHNNTGDNKGYEFHIRDFYFNPDNLDDAKNEIVDPYYVSTQLNGWWHWDAPTSTTEFYGRPEAADCPKDQIFKPGETIYIKESKTIKLFMTQEFYVED